MAVRRLEYRIRDESTALNQKLYYLFYTPTDFAAGKDFRLFRIGDWFGELFSVFLSEKSRLTGKNEFWWFAVNALQGILSFARDGICYFLLIKMVLEGRITAGDFTMYFGAVAGFSVWLNDIAHQTGNPRPPIPFAVGNLQAVVFCGTVHIACAFDLNEIAWLKLTQIG